MKCSINWNIFLCMIDMGSLIMNLSTAMSMLLEKTNG